MIGVSTMKCGIINKGVLTVCTLLPTFSPLNYPAYFFSFSLSKLLPPQSLFYNTEYLTQTITDSKQIKTSYPSSVPAH